MLPPGRLDRTIAPDWQIWPCVGVIGHANALQGALTQVIVGPARGS